MPVTQQLMRPGSFDLQLVEDHPWSASNAVDFYDHIVITATRLEPITGFSDANILDSAIYTGVVVRRPSPASFSGHDLSYWLGTPNGTGDILDVAQAGSAATLSTWITALKPASISAGTVTDTGTTFTGTFQWITRREAIDAVCRGCVAEWRVNPDGTLDAGHVATMFPSSSIVTDVNGLPITDANGELVYAVMSSGVVVTRKEEGQDGEYRGLDGTLINTAKDVEQYATKVLVAGQGTGVTMTTASATGSTSYVDFLNGAVVMEMLVDSPESDATAAASMATDALAQFNVVRRELSLSSDTHTVTRFVKPGDYVYAFDQYAELTDAANQITYRGELITPIRLRVYVLTWPIVRGMGVYARRSGATPVYTDLTDWVQWEDGGEVSWDVGSMPRPSSEWV